MSTELLMKVATVPNRRLEGGLQSGFEPLTSTLGFQNYLSQYGGLMSDCRAIYRKVKEFVKCLYPGEPKGFFQRNLNTLTSMITGIIIGQETQLPQIANNVPDYIKLPRTEKRFKRLINPSVNEKTFFLPFIQSLLNKLSLEEMVLAIDGSLVGRGCICIMISLIYRRRALLLVFTVVKGKKGHLSEETHVDLVNRLRP